VLVFSPVIAGEIAAMYQSISEEAAWRLSLHEGGGLRWTANAAADGVAPAEASEEPGASLWLRIALRLLTPLAPEEML